jgi:cytochrome c oxidase subunit 2
LAVLALLLAVASCGGEYPQSSVDPRTDFAQAIHSLYVLIFWITLVILAIVWGVLGYILVRFRARPGAPKPRQIRGHLGLELIWTAIPAVIVIGIAVPTVQTVFRTQRSPGPDILVVDVIGHQFWWEFRYPDGVVTANDLHLPVGVPVTLRLRSADVIHSFWIPMLGGKRDVNPQVAEPPAETPTEEARGPEPGAGGAGAFNYLHFTVSEPGVYRGQCAEFCGSSHSLMGVRVVAQSPFEYRAWLQQWRGPASDTAAADSAVAPGAGVAESEQAEAAVRDSVAAALDSAAAPDPAVVAAAGGAGRGGAARVELGRQTFHSSSCIACHAIQGTTAMGVIGPNLTLFGQRATVAGWLENNPDNLVRWITAPQSVKPGARMPGIAEPGGNFPPTNLSEAQVRAVAEYLFSLGRAPGGAP